MLFTLAWRNIWRNRKRSLILYAGISSGLLLGLFSCAMMFGMGETFIRSSIDRDLGHAQIHTREYASDRQPELYIRSYRKILKSLTGFAEISAAAPRTIIEGMAASAASSTGISIIGIEPSLEKKVTSIHKNIISGGYLDSGSDDSIVVGRKLAESLNIANGSKVVLSFPDLEGNIIYAAFRIKGIFKTDSSSFDKTHVFIKASELFSLLGSEEICHAIIIKSSSAAEAEKALIRLKTSLQDLSVRGWKELAPELKMIDEMIATQLNIFLGIILLALLFGITNTMLMSVLERIREIGVLMAIGMKRSRVFLMIIMETVTLSLAGGATGMLLALIAVNATGITGIDLSAFSEGLSSWDISPIIYPVLPGFFYASITIMTIVTAVTAAVYPAAKAVRLNPSAVIRTS